MMDELNSEKKIQSEPVVDPLAEILAPVLI